MKSGTTTIESVLRALPSIELVNEKETSVFLDPDGEGVKVARKMRESTAVASGEVSTAYMQRPLHEVDTQRTIDLVGHDVLIICVLRDPFERALSHWRHWAQLGLNQTDDVSSALLDPFGPYQAFSKYAYQLEPWVRVVGVGNILPLRLEDYARDPRSWTAPLCDALRVEEPSIPPALHANKGDTRIVADRLGKHIMNSTAYRRVVRPLTPPWMRRSALLMLGGRRGGNHVGGVSDTVELAFRSLIQDDSERLRAQWRELEWRVS
jgi:hypothetical protein